MNRLFNYISSRNKVLCLASLLLTTSIVCPLTSCGSDNTSNDIGGFDKEFGFDAQTYNNLERQFKSKYAASLWNETHDTNEYENKFNNFLQNDLTSLRNNLFDPAQNYSFTVRTNTLIDYASKNYNIRLNRNANVSEVDFDNLKQSSLENFVIYMENMGFTEDEIDKKTSRFNKKFDEILEKCKSKTSDNAQILMQLRADVIDCWADLDDEFAHMSAYNHLRSFFDEYEFVVKDQKDNANYLWDFLLITPGFMGGKENCGKINQDINCKITDYWIRKLFTISKISEGKTDNVVTTNVDPNASANKILDFNSKEIIPGFILTPVLKTMSQDIYSNNYYMDIDWQLMSNSYENKNQKTQDKVTAHLDCNGDETVINYADLKDRQLLSNSHQFTRYSLMATSMYQQEKMIEAYFDQTKEPDQKITFSWNKDMIGVESFLKSDSIGANGEYNLPQESYEVSMSKNNLSLIGLQLNGTNLFDLLNKKTNLQDSQSATNTDNDDNLRIEEKFVKYCDIDTIANVSFFDNTVSKNSIQTDFIVSFGNNTESKCKVETKSNMNNIGPSKNFSNNAVNFYEKVVDYIDSKKILKEIEEWNWLSISIKLMLYISFTFIGLLFISVLTNYKLITYRGHRIMQDFNRIKDLILWLIYISWLLIITLALYFTWKLTVINPISEEVDKVTKWNEMITNKSKSDLDNKINVMDKVNVDKDNFKSTDDFMKYYNTNSNSAFASYFYYFHFVELSQKQTNDEQSTILDKTNVKKDYDDFIKAKDKCGINDRNFARIFIAVMSLLASISLCLMLYVSLIKSAILIEAWFKFKRAVDGGVHRINP